MYSLDCIPSPNHVNSRSAADCLAMYSPLPDTFSLVKNLPPVRDQGLQGCCVAHCVTCMKEEQERRDVNFKRYFSPDFIYNLRPNRPQPGMYIEDALQIVKCYGVIPEKSWTGNINQPELLQKAYNYRIRNYVRVITMLELKYALMEAGPCPIAFPVYRLDGKIWSASESNPTPLGYHAMAVVGWNTTGFILRNSWGANWGDSGYVIYPYTDWGVHCEIWTSYDDQSTSNSSDITISGWTRFIQYIRKKLRL